MGDQVKISELNVRSQEVTDLQEMAVERAEIGESLYWANQPGMHFDGSIYDADGFQVADVNCQVAAMDDDTDGLVMTAVRTFLGKQLAEIEERLVAAGVVLDVPAFVPEPEDLDLEEAA